MADSQFPEQCVQCNFNFLSVSGSSIPVFIFCPICSWPRAKPIGVRVQDQDSTDESSVKSCTSIIHGINQDTNAGAMEKPSTSHPGQNIEKTPNKSAIENISTGPAAERGESSVNGSSNSHAEESTSNGISEVEKNSVVQKQQREAEQLTINTKSHVCEQNMEQLITLDHNRISSEHDADKHSPVITDSGASITNHEGRKVEAQNGGHGKMSEALEVSPNSQVS